MMSLESRQRLFERQEAEKLWQRKMCEYAETRHVESRSAVGGEVKVKAMERHSRDREEVSPEVAGSRGGKGLGMHQLVGDNTAQSVEVDLSERFGNLTVTVSEPMKTAENTGGAEFTKESDVSIYKSADSSTNVGTTVHCRKSVAMFEREEAERMRWRRMCEIAEMEYEEKKANEYHQMRVKGQMSANQDAESGNKDQSSANQDAGVGGKGQSSANQDAESAAKGQSSAKQDAESGAKGQSSANQDAGVGGKGQSSTNQDAESGDTTAVGDVTVGTVSGFREGEHYGTEEDMWESGEFQNGGMCELGKTTPGSGMLSSSETCDQPEKGTDHVGRGNRHGTERGLDDRTHLVDRHHVLANIQRRDVEVQTEPGMRITCGLTHTEADTQTDSPETVTMATSFPEDPIRHTDSETQTHHVFSECCRCGQFSSPESVRLTLDLKRERGQRMALEKLVSIVEHEARDLRQQLLLEQTATCTTQNELIDVKAELNNARRMSSEYKLRVEELEQSLQGARQMVFKMEEQIENTNYFKSGVDYLLEAKLSSSRAAEAQKKLESVQTELLRSQQEVNHLLDKLADANKEKSDMVSSTIHHELLKISEQRAKDAERKSQQLEYEVHQLKEQLHASPKKTVSFAADTEKPPEQKINRSPTTTGGVLKKNKEPSFQYEFYSTGSALKSLGLLERGKGGGGQARGSEEAAFQLPEITASRTSSAKIGEDPTAFTGTPLMVSAPSDSDSDWSSSDNERDKADQFSPPAKKPKPMRKQNSPERRRPPVAPKPTLPRKPTTTTTTTTTRTTVKSVEEKPVSFDDQIKGPSLAVKRRLSGPKGRARPSKFRKPNISK